MPVCLYNSSSQQTEQQQQATQSQRSLHVLTSLGQRQQDGFSAIEWSQLSPNSMPCWYYDKKELRNTSSIRDGLPFETERRYRKEGARFIMSCGTQMGLGHNTIATGVVYFHRFYMFHSFRTFPRYLTACCCLFLAGKVEETPKKCRDVIKTARVLLNDNYFYSFGEDPKEEVMTLERILLQTIKFDLQVEHPYTFLLKYAKCLKGDQQKLQKMVQMAWNFVNDSLSTTVCLQWEPEIIAVALIHLASKLSKFVVSDWNGRQEQHLRWWDMFVGDVTMEVLEDICHQVLDLYQNSQKEDPNGSESPPQKPPSRADSPTPLVKSPAQLPPPPPPPASHQSFNTHYKHTNTASAVGSSAANELSNIQAIKSLVNVAPQHQPHPQQRLMSNAAHIPLPSTAANYYNAESGHNMYAQAPPLPGIPLPPPPSHIGYSDAPPPPPLPPSALSSSVTAPAVVRTVPQPPLPPLPPSSSWTNNVPHYTHIPPMPMPPLPNAVGIPSSGRATAPPPPNGGNNYYHHQQHHHLHQPHASSSTSSSSSYHHHHHHRSQRY